MNVISKNETRKFWQSHPLGNYEIVSEQGSEQYFRQLDLIRCDSSRFSMPLYGFDNSRSKMVLDIGCGPGWLTFNYAKNGADIFSLDFTFIAADMTRKNLQSYNLKSKVAVADAENLPFKDNSFEFICCDGVLHHTPDAARGMAEIWRVLKPKSRALVSVYYKNWMLKKYTFPLTIRLMSFLRVWTPHGLNPKTIRKLSLDDFGRFYDGEDNPLGKIYTEQECLKLFNENGFKILKKEIHYFPVRFLPFAKYLPKAAIKFLDNICGTMIYFILEK